VNSNVSWVRIPRPPPVFDDEVPNLFLESTPLTKNAKALNRANPRHGVLKARSTGRNVVSLLWRGLAVLLSATLIVVGYSAGTIASQLKNGGIQLTDANGNAIAAPANLKGPINMLLVGSDTRAGQGGGFGNVTSNLADVIILLHVSANRKNAVAMSFPRDLMVPFPACPSTTGGSGYLPQSLGQINATIANGGPGCTLLTIESITGLKIPYLAMINFKGVIEMSNAVGGVDVCVANRIHDTYTRLDLGPGMHTLQGLQALQFLRTRHGIGDGSDLSRISNQQVFMSSLFRKIKSQGVLTNPVYLYSLASAAARNMTLSSNMTDLSVLVGLASSLKKVSPDTMTFIQVPSMGGMPAPNQGRVQLVPDQAQLLFTKLQNDEPLVLAKSNPGAGAQATATPTAAPAPSASASASPSASSSALPDWVRGTKGSSSTCSN
jgi:LCP family protein required for cell wall assembly